MSRKTEKLKNYVLFLSGIGTIYAGSIKLKQYIGGQIYDGQENLYGKTVIITGGNNGIGKATAFELANRGAKIVLASRNLEKCEKAREDIVLESMNKNVFCRKCNLASQNSIREFVKQFEKENSELHILINNAGERNYKKKLTEEGIEAQLGINYLGHFLLTNLLLHLLKRSEPSRIINVSCPSYRKGEINVMDLNSDNIFDGEKAYAQSKLAIMLFTKELALQLKGSKVTINAVNPGASDTDILRESSYSTSIISKIFVKPFLWPLLKTPKQAAQTIIYAALNEHVNNVSGSYFVDFKNCEMNISITSEKLSKWLWETSCKWTRLT
ncbi:retinol dehydrogenase 13-like [Prorops nasuta]|uniref:retinol dehydrogenase 13-like n=1 Tax=Prorops nasuta TaxID=863751 RepID=UPI0034CEC86A